MGRAIVFQAWFMGASARLRRPRPWFVERVLPKSKNRDAVSRVLDSSSYKQKFFMMMTDRSSI
jgi:hypothetical protein